MLEILLHVGYFYVDFLSTRCSPSPLLNLALNQNKTYNKENEENLKFKSGQPFYRHYAEGIALCESAYGTVDQWPW